MCEVFAAAKSVIAWLDEPSDNGDDAIQLVLILYSATDKLSSAGEPITKESLTKSPLCEYLSS
jgi:hypothetical protein